MTVTAISIGVLGPIILLAIAKTSSSYVAFGGQLALGMLLAIWNGAMLPVSLMSRSLSAYVERLLASYSEN